MKELRARRIRCFWFCEFVLGKRIRNLRFYWPTEQTGRHGSIEPSVPRLLHRAFGLDWGSSPSGAHGPSVPPKSLCFVKKLCLVFMVPKTYWVIRITAKSPMFPDKMKPASGSLEIESGPKVPKKQKKCIKEKLGTFWRWLWFFDLMLFYISDFISDFITDVNSL